MISFQGSNDNCDFYFCCNNNTHTGGIDIQQFERKSTRTSVVVVVVLVARRWCENQATTDGQRMKKETKTRHTHFGPPSTALVPLSLSLSQAHALSHKHILSLTHSFFLSLSFDFYFISCWLRRVLFWISDHRKREKVWVRVWMCMCVCVERERLEGRKERNKKSTQLPSFSLFLLLSFLAHDKLSPFQSPFLF